MCNILANVRSSHHSIGYFLLDFALCFAMCNQLANDSLSHYLFYKIQRTCYCSSSLYPYLQRACQCEPLPYLWPMPPISNEKGVRRRARAFSCAFPHFLSRFSKYFLPRVSTLFNVVHGMVLPLRGGWGGVRWHAPHIPAPPPVPWHAMHLRCASQKLTSPKWSANE